MIKPVTKFDVYSGQKGIVINWIKSTGATKYNIYKKINKQKFKLLKTVGNIATYTDTNVKSGVGYTYYITATNGKEVSKASKEDYEYYLKTPVVTFANNNPAQGVLIQWEKITGATAYRIIKHIGSKATVLDTVKTLSYLDKNVKHANRYVYSVQAICPTKTVTYSSAHPMQETYFVAKPTGVKVNAVGQKVTVSWDLDPKVTGQNIHWTQDKSFQKTGRTSIMVENTKEKSKSFTVKTGTVYVRIQRYLQKNGKKYWGAFSDIYELKIKAPTTSNITTLRKSIAKKNSGSTCTQVINTIKGPLKFTAWSQGGFGISWLKGSGCGVCAFITAIKPFFSKYKNATPKTFYKTVLEKKRFGEINRGGSIGYGIMKTIVEEAGGKAVVQRNYTLTNAIKDIEKHLYSGQPVVITVRSQAFLGNKKKDKKYTSYAHYIALLGMTEDGKVIAADSSKHLWSLDGIGQVRFKIGNLKDILEHTQVYSTLVSPSMWYSNSGSNGYIKIYV